MKVATLNISPVVDAVQLAQDIDYIRIGRDEEARLAHGGSKGSRYGAREQGTCAAEFFTTVKTAYCGV